MHETAVQWIKAQEKILLVAHVSPDGDTLGSCLALYLALVSLGKSAQVLSEDPVPQAYRFLPGAANIKRPEEMNEENVPAVIAVDCADRLRMGMAEPLFDRAKTTLNIDHHGTNTAFAEVNDVRRAGATGELIYEIIRLLNVSVTEDMAVCLYTALATDTGNFSYSNTTPNTFRIMSELLETGFPLPEINRMLFRSTPLRKLKLQARALDKLELHCGGKVAISAISLSDFSDCGATAEDHEGVVDLLRDIDTVEAAAALRACEDGTVRVSLRGKRYADVSRVAVALHGGGHKLAAGCTICGSLEAAKSAVLAELRKLFPEERV